MIIELSKNEKLQKYRNIQSQQTNNLHKRLLDLNFDIFTADMVIFFSTGFLNMCNHRTTFCLVWWPGLSGLQLFGWWDSAGLVWWQKFSCKLSLSFFISLSSSSTKQAVPLTYSIISPFLSNFCLFWKYHFALNFELGVLKL